MGRTARTESVLDATPEHLDTLQDLIADLWEASDGVALLDRMRVETAAVEIFANIVEHSVRSHTGPRVRRVEVVLEAGDELITIRFADDGMPVAIDLHHVTMPDAEAERGRGLALALAAVDDIAYERQGDANRWTISCRRSS